MMALVWRGCLFSLMFGLAQASAAQPLPPVGGGAPMSLAALKQIEPGLWQLDVKGRARRLVCVSDAVNLVQIEHDQPGCSRFVIANEPRSSTVHYSCQRAGWGRTTIRVETGRLVTIQTQGISRNAPFDYSIEARRIGECATGATARQR